MTTYPCLLPPNWDLPFHVYYDASKVAIGSVLCQPIGENHKVHPIAFASRQLTATERNYSTTERECLAMVFIVKKFRHYLLLNPVVFFIDHMALKYLVNKLDLSGRLACWILLLEEFDYIVEYKPCPMHKQANFVIVRIHCEQKWRKRLVFPFLFRSKPTPLGADVICSTVRLSSIASTQIEQGCQRI